MFERFPKTRPPLPPAIQAIYAAHYKSNREGRTAASSLAQRAESWLHRQVAADLAGRRPGDGGPELATLEIGAGTLNQLQYEPPLGPYDVVEPFESLYAGSPRLARIRRVYADVAEIPADRRYDRITSVATFEHVTALPAVVARAGLLLAPGGVLRTAIPSEGTFLWTLGWKMTTGLEFRLRHGLDYGLLLRHEHVNDAAEIEEVLRHFFAETKEAAFGLGKKVSLYQFYANREPLLDRCRAYLAAG